MLRNPRVYAKVKEEIRGAFKSAAHINLADAMELPYLTACIEENLRIFPPAPIGFLRTIQAGGDVVDGQHIPGGVSWFSIGYTFDMSNLVQTAVSVSSWCAHHSPDNFKDPDEFIPERWTDKEYDADQKSAMRAFSLGPRGCIGKE